MSWKVVSKRFFWNHNHQKQLVSKTQFWKVFGRYLERNFGCLKSQQLPSLLRGYLQQPSRPFWKNHVGIMPYWFCCKTFMWYYVIWLCMIVYDYGWLCMITWLGFTICDTLITVVNQQVPLRGRLAWHVRKARISPLKQPLGQQAWKGAVCFASIVVLSENDSQSPSPKNKSQAAEEALCIPCAVGNYSNKIGQAACHFCPKGRHGKNCLSRCIWFQRVPWWRIDTNDIYWFKGCWYALMDNGCKRIPWHNDWLRCLTSQVTMAMPLAWQHVGHAQRAHPPNRMVPFAQICAMRV